MKKSRLVVHGFKYEHSFDFDEVFALIIKWSTIRSLAARVAIIQYFIHHLNIKTTFSQDDLSNKVYIEQLLRFIEKRNEHIV